MRRHTVLIIPLRAASDGGVDQDESATGEGKPEEGTPTGQTVTPTARVSPASSKRSPPD